MPDARHDLRYRCARSLIVFTCTDDEGNVRCVSCQRILTPATDNEGKADV
jgi:hypothetical protein